eukprot:CAMPEP_0176342178 /NCGR_PEP_ID=MMETSP0126-20121128/2975_1 /TAXON_ID=141414 ORGANISM="Strombidinopsis acuminatum, Strain SPMC142" /NCGR_SAMPLE_ID=MMETSP0126 /ASSEMBLY_ACC=CAM_ASM_000229 /LENGTH=93 /DNA_ID=CAMNT_0017687449 /DNA_START=379 /DNA_END=660 /DNA_ORIENTATION=+
MAHPANLSLLFAFITNAVYLKFIPMDWLFGILAKVENSMQVVKMDEKELDSKGLEGSGVMKNLGLILIAIFGVLLFILLLVIIGWACRKYEKL